MAHNISIDPETGEPAMMYYKDPPWHGLGTMLDHPATSAEAIRAAKLDWEVVKQPMFVRVGDDLRLVKDKFVMMRADQIKQGPYFGIVSSGYTPLQNSEAFQFFDDIVGEGAAIYHTAGALGDGERIWILARLPENIRVVGDDICKKYLLLSNSHDGQSSVQIKFTPVRVVCQNTLTLALNQGPTLRVSHTRNMRQNMDRARELLGIITKRYKGIAESFQQMAAVRMDQSKLFVYYKMVFPDPKDTKDEAGLKRAIELRRSAEVLYTKGAGNDARGVANTLWAAYNGITEMVDHPAIGGGTSRLLNHIWFGDGYLVKARAYTAAVDLSKRWAA